MRYEFKVLAITIILSAIAMKVFAQQPTQEFNLKVDTKDIDLISEGLGSLPYNKVAPLFGKLAKQLSLQQQSVPAPMPTNPKPVPQPPAE